MTICVHGLGYVGLATAAHFANHGHSVVGFDTDDAVLARLRRGEPATGEAELEAYVEQALSDGLTVSDEPVPADYHLVCVPTPYDRGRGAADLRYVEAAARNVATQLREGDTVVLESTVPPGTTRGRFAGPLEEAGFDPGRDVELGYTPETILPGNTVTELRTNDRIVGGVDRRSTESITELYRPVTTGKVYPAPDTTTAEFVKLAQNAARDVEIAYANTLALVADDYGVDVRSAIALANNHPRVDILDPGPGVGGHCLPVDPLFLGRRSGETDLLDCARRINDRMPDHVVERLDDALGGLDGATVALLGLSYKGNVADTRNSPGLAILRRLTGEVAPVRSSEVAVRTDGSHPDVDVRVHDPRVTDAPVELRSLKDAVDGADAVVLAAGHDEFAGLDPDPVGELLARRLVVDPIGLLDRDRWTNNGFEVVGL
jgi:UDP-N-acetyl-D-mannosaminuronic acid dehydrogenase